MIIVTGIHNSGSSCLSMVLHKLGVKMFDKQAPGAHSKKGGSGEDSKLAYLCELIYPFPSMIEKIDMLFKKQWEYING